MRLGRRGVLATVLAIVAGAGLGLTQPAAADTTTPQASVVSVAEHPVAGTYLVTLAGNSAVAKSADATVRAAHELTDRYGGQLKTTLTATMRGFVVEDLSTRQANKLAAHPDVAEVRQSGRAGIGGPGGTQQNPPNWGLDRIDQRDRPLDNAYTYPNDGAGVNIYVVDTGIRYSHQEFEGRAKFGVDLYARPNQGEDCHNHGTHVSGIAAGKTRGVAKKANLVSVRVLGCDGQGEDVDVVEAAEWITKNAVKPAVVNLSVYTGDRDIAASAIQGSVRSGVQWSLITGNNGGDACAHGPGGQVPEALQVGNSTSSDSRASDSNAGRCMDLFAPGSNINSAYRGSDSAYGTLSGTSMAAPHVAGAMALRLHDSPNSAPAALHTWVMDNASSGKMSGLPAGTPDKLLHLPRSAPPGEPVARFHASCPTGSLTCTLDGSASSAENGDIATYAWSFGDGENGDGKVAQHAYAQRGTYTVRLTVTDAQGRSGSTEQPVRVGDTSGGQPPTASLTVDCGTSLSCAFDGTGSSDPDSDITTYTWDFGDGTGGTGASARHTYPARNGTYTVKLAVTDGSGNTDTAQQSVRCWAFTAQGFCFRA
ncbi:PKD domain-containing protein [Streptomyces zagrosensis]|uniref:Subtilisin family serine protease n=1 Tax=Streptomyces zagrosensis TaxID=1042984 RepID=A0A7W9UY33_9ACTN|nr:PKD domain-containing protein [Streptomyces zagrosensis]MBB5935538.1 subtilisin family serine protease [Streptomyces zagrosensis]